MAEISIPSRLGGILFDLHIPVSKVDGNVDMNGDGKLDVKDKNGKLDECELWEEVLNHRDLYAQTLKKMVNAGLEDPLEELPEIKARLEYIFNKFKPTNEYDKAVLIMRSYAPENVIIYNDHNSDLLAKYSSGAVDRKDKAVTSILEQYSGLSAKDKGLAIEFDEPFSDATELNGAEKIAHIQTAINGSPLRNKYYSLLPKELLAAPAAERKAKCDEFANLLLVHLRMAGIKCKANYEPNHENVIAVLDGKQYRLEKYSIRGLKDFGRIMSDRQNLAAHYANKGVICDYLGDMDGAVEYYRQAARIEPANYQYWAAIGDALNSDVRFDEALGPYTRALELNPGSAPYWNNKGMTLLALGRKDEAVVCFKKAVEIQPEKYLKKYKHMSALKGSF